MTDMNKIAPLFDGWNETMIWSCLQGHMGYAVTDNDSSPTAAEIVIGDFSFFGGKPNEALVANADRLVMVPQNDEWLALIAKVWGTRANERLRYSIKKEPDVFNTAFLEKTAAALSPKFTMKLFDREICEMALMKGWAKSFCVHFDGPEDFVRRGIGVAVMDAGELVAGASSYTFYNGGIEIEIATQPDYRQKGLAIACGAKLILECLKRGLYPSWDACDLRSVALAERLGYHMDKPYTVYIKTGGGGGGSPPRAVASRHGRNSNTL